MAQKRTATDKSVDLHISKARLKAKHKGKTKGQLTTADAIEYAKEIMASELELPK